MGVYFLTGILEPDDSDDCVQGCIQNIFPGGGVKLGPHKRMTLAIMIFAYICASICLIKICFVCI